jgi:hypothetical protein
VPGPVCWLRTSRLYPAEFQIVQIGADVIRYIGGRGIEVLTFTGSNFSEWEYSTDRRNWQPCTVVEP